MEVRPRLPAVRIAGVRTVLGVAVEWVQRDTGETQLVRWRNGPHEGGRI